MLKMKKDYFLELMDFNGRDQIGQKIQNMMLGKHYPMKK